MQVAPVDGFGLVALCPRPHLTWASLAHQPDSANAKVMLGRTVLPDHQCADESNSCGNCNRLKRIAADRAKCMFVLIARDLRHLQHCSARHFRGSCRSRIVHFGILPPAWSRRNNFRLGNSFRNELRNLLVWLRVGRRRQRFGFIRFGVAHGLFALLEVRERVNQTPPHRPTDKSRKNSPQPLANRLGRIVHAL